MSGTSTLSSRTGDHRLSQYPSVYNFSFAKLFLLLVFIFLVLSALVYVGHVELERQSKEERMEVCREVIEVQGSTTTTGPARCWRKLIPPPEQKFTIASKGSRGCFDITDTVENTLVKICQGGWFELYGGKDTAKAYYVRSSNKSDDIPVVISRGKYKSINSFPFKLLYYD